MAEASVAEQNLPSHWRLKPSWTGCEELAGQTRIPRLLSQLLYNRGIANADEARRFLQPTLNDLIDPHQMNGMRTAATRLQQAITNGEKIVLYGDYDVDGIAGVAILWRCLQLAGVTADYYVPHRIEEGYGLNTEAIDQLVRNGADLIVTVDCGISAHEQAQHAAGLGVDLIITDHHKPDSTLPHAVAIVHPNLPDQNYPNKYLSGAAVAFKLAWALAQQLSGTPKVTPEFRDFLIDATALAALGTIADVVPLQGENRILAKFGLEGLAASNNTGIVALIEAAGLTGARLQSTDIGFRLAPRLNAAGRMGHARLAVELFTKSEPERAQQIAAYLESQNRKRQKTEKDITADAMRQVTALAMDKPPWRCLVLAGDNWHAGVIGIVASRLVDKYHKPSVVISLQGDRATGSCRSIDGFDMHLALQNCSQHLLNFGGHAMAAGVRLEAAGIEAFRNTLNEYACQKLTDNDLTPTVEIDAQVTLAELDLHTAEMISRLEPFGTGNKKAVLLARNLRLTCPPRRMGRKGNHLQLSVAAAGDDEAHLRSGGVMRAVAFGKSQWEKKLLNANTFDLVFSPNINRFNGNTTVEMTTHDLITY